MAWLNLIPRWALLAALVAALAAAAYQSASLAVARGELVAAERRVSELRQAVAIANTEAANKAAALQSTVVKAQNEARSREVALRSLADAAGAELDGMQRDLAGLRDQLASASSEARAERAAALGAVLSQCAARHQDLAQRCDRHVNDIRTLIDAWPQ